MKTVDRLNERLMELLAEIKLCFYIADKSDFIFEQLNYPYRLFSVNDFMNKNNNLNIDKIKSVLKTKKNDFGLYYNTKKDKLIQKILF